MAKLFTFNFLVILFMSQKCAVSLADDTDQRVITEIAESLETITTKIQDVMIEVSTRLPQAVSQFEINLKQSVERLKSEDLTDETKTAMAHCISESRDKADVMKSQLQELLQRAKTLGSDATVQIEECLTNVQNQNNMAGLMSCLTLVDELRNEIENTLVLTETGIADISGTFDACIAEAESQNHVYHHTDEL